jgi:hypothetical protein
MISVESMTPEACAAMAEASSKARPTAQQRAEFATLVRWLAGPARRAVGPRGGVMTEKRDRQV